MAHHLPPSPRPAPPLSRPLAGRRPDRVATRLVAFALPLALAATMVAACSRARPSAPPRPLRIATYSGPLSLDPHLKNELATFSVLGNVYDSLVAFDSQLRITPALAVAWENPNDLTWRFHLRAGVRFQDGRALTADDVVASLERVRHHPKSGLGNYLVTVDTIRELSPDTIEITTRRPSPVLLNKLTFVFIVPRDAPAEIRQPIGTGPYRVVESDAHHVRFAAFPQSWRGAPPERDVDLLILPDPAERLARLERGDVDLVQEVEPERAAEVRRQPHCRVLAGEGISVEYLALRLDSKPFSDLRVREAMNLAIDRDALVRDHLRGQGLPLGQMVGRQVFGYAPDLKPPLRDIALAKRLLAAAGYPDGFDIDLELREGKGADVLVRQLADVGIRVRQVPRAWSAMYKRLQDGAVAFYLGSFVAGSADASDLFDSKVHTRDEASGYGDINFSGFSDRSLDRMIEASATTMDMIQRRTQLQSVMRRLMEELPLIPLYDPFRLYGVRDDVRFEVRRDGMVRLFDVSRQPGGGGGAR